MKNKKMWWYMTMWEFILYGFSVWGILAWYDWKLLIILILFVWSNNITIDKEKYK